MRGSCTPLRPEWPLPFLPAGMIEEDKAITVLVPLARNNTQSDLDDLADTVGAASPADLVHAVEDAFDTVSATIIPWECKQTSGSGFSTGARQGFVDSENSPACMCLVAGAW